MKKKIIIAGGTGFLAQCIYRNFPGEDIEFIALCRRPYEAFCEDTRVRFEEWDGKTVGNWQQLLEGAEAVINLAGRSVNCRYTPQNQKEIIASRVESTNAIGIAINRCEKPPKVWINAGSAAIYGNRGSDILTEESALGEGFSPDVCKQWEETFYDIITPLTRKVFLRISFVLGKHGGALEPMAKLAANGLGGKQGSGKQFMSWIHEKDFVNVVIAAIERETMEGTYNCTSPKASENAYFMHAVRQNVGMPIGLPTPTWLLKLGARIINTEEELVLNSRIVVPKRLEEEGFVFEYADLHYALAELLITDHTVLSSNPELVKKIRNTIAWYVVLGVTICLSPILALWGDYGSTLFVLLPASIGFTWAMIKSRSARASAGELLLSTLLISAGTCLLFLLLGVEGIICLIMAVPIIVPLMLIGALIGYLVQNKIWARLYAPMLVLLLNPAALIYDLKLQDFESSTVKTEMVIQASDRQVWAELEKPFEFGKSSYFFLKEGVSYPIAMKLEKQGDCNFLACEYSNGKLRAVVDSISENKLLRFKINEAPVSMSETSIYPNIEPEHVRSKFIVDYGEFRIEPLSDKSCKLIATTAYRYKVGPTWYWRLWSDRLVNQMHTHVLKQLKAKAEQDANHTN